MEVAALLPPALLTQLRVALGPGHRVLAAEGWRELDALARRERVDVVVLDPQHAEGGAGAVEEVLGFAARHPSLPLVQYVVLTPASLRAVVELARHGHEQVVLHRFDDDPLRFRELLERHAGDALT